jgi:hypothetical protein
MKRTIKLLSFIGIFALLFSCRKADSFQKSNSVKGDEVGNPVFHREGDAELYQQVVGYLESYQETLTAYQASKIDTLLGNIVDSNLMVITVDDSTNFIVCDLVTYKNPSVPEYSNTFYKAYFTVMNGQVEGGLYFTIHTDLSKAEVDADLGKILLRESTSFTGITAYNLLNDQFDRELVFTAGHLDSEYELSLVDLNGRPGVAAEGCTIYYIVRTTLWLSGKIDREIISQFTLCGNCIPTGERISTIISDCEPNSGGGSSSPTTVVFPCGRLWIPLADQGSCGVTMLHCYDVTENHYVKRVHADPATCDETYIYNCTYLGKSTKRWAAPTTHHPDMVPYGVSSMRITWKYTVNYLYTWNNQTSNFPVYQTPGFYQKVVQL